MQLVKSKKSTVERTDEEVGLKILGEQAPVGVCIMQDGKFCYVNSYFSIGIGYTAEELVGKDSGEIVAPEDREKVRENTIKMLRGELVSPYQFRAIHKDGSARWVMTTVKPIQYHGRGAVLGIYMEAAERMQMEDRLEESEQRYRLLLEASQDYIVQMDREGRYLVANPAAAGSLGVPLEELIGKTMLEVMPQEIAQLRLGIVRRVLDEWQPRVFEDERAGRYFRHTVIPTKTSGGKEVAQVITRDITGPKKAEEALRQSEERYRTILEEMEEGYYEEDIAGNFTFVNDALCHMLGYSRDELIGLNYKIYTPKEEVKPIFQAYNRVFRTGEPLKWFPMPEIRKDGTRILAEDSVFPLLNEEGEVIGFRGISRDITERKKAEEALRQSEERYRTVLEQTGDGYFETDLAGNLTFVNDAMIRLLGYSREELIGMNFRTFTSEEKAKTVFQAYNRMYRTGEPLCDLPTEVIRKDGGHRFAETSAFPIRNDKGEIVGFRGVRRDITEQKQAQEALRQSEERYRTILEEMENSYFEVDLGGHLTFVNNSVCSNLGYSREELMGMSYKKFTSEDDAASVHRVFNEVYQTGVPNKGFLWKMIRRDGGQGFVETSVSLLRNDKGEVVGFRGVGRDVTERRNMEQMLGLQRAYFQQLFDNSPDAIVMVDSDEKVVEVNSGFEALFGYTAEESRGRSIDDLIVPEDSVKESAVLSRAVLHGETIRKEIVRRRRDGSLVAVSILAYPIRFDEELVGGYVIYSDIAKRKKMEEALRQSEENLRTLFDSSVIGTIVLDPETGQVVTCNQAAAKMLGFSSVDEAVGVNAIDFVFPDDKERVLEIIAKELLEQDLWRTHEFRAVTQDGRTIWISVTATMIRHEGKLAGLVSFTDITEQKQQSERLMIADRLASLGELAAGAAHELNNPLTGIIGFSQLLLEKDIPDDIREDLKLICSEAQRAAAVTKDLLTFARGSTPMRQPNQINTIIEGVLRLRGYEQKANGIEVRKQLSPTLPEVMVDYSQMQQVFLNIIINAEFFMIEAHKKGTLTITTRRQNGRLEISFADDGPGIPSENLKRIFDPFFTTKEPGKGTGLGLSICHGIVTQHGGQIYARSQPGKGTTIVVELPVS